MNVENNLKSTLYTGIIKAMGGTVDDLPDNLETTYLRRILECVSGGSGGGVTSWNDLTDKPFGKTEGVDILTTGDDFTFIEESGVYVCAITSVPTVGETYTVTYNGVDYETVAIQTSDGVALGNLAMMGLDDTGEPFIVMSTVSEMMAVVMPLDGATLTSFKISGMSTFIKKLDPIFYDTPILLYTNKGDYWLYTDSDCTTRLTYDELRAVARRPIIVYDLGDYHHNPIVSTNGEVTIFQISSNDTGTHVNPQTFKAY